MNNKGIALEIVKSAINLAQSEIERIKIVTGSPGSNEIQNALVDEVAKSYQLILTELNKNEKKLINDNFLDKNTALALALEMTKSFRPKSEEIGKELVSFQKLLQSYAEMTCEIYLRLATKELS